MLSVTVSQLLDTGNTEKVTFFFICYVFVSKQKKEYILDKDGNKIYDPKKRQYKCKSIPATDWNEQTKAEEWRAAWAGLCNQALEQNGHAERVDLNREIEVINQKLRQLKARISKLQNWLKEEAENTKPPTLADYIQGICHARHRRGKRDIRNRCIISKTRRKC